MVDGKLKLFLRGICANRFCAYTNIVPAKFLILWLQVLVNKLQLSEAIGACHLDGSLSVNSLHYHVEKARRLLQVDIREGLVVKTQKDEENNDIIIYDNISPLSDSSIEPPKKKARRKGKTRQTG
jgi:hypothetical protein